MIPKKIIANSDVKLSTFLNSVLQKIPNTQFDIATPYFNIQAYAFIKDNIKGIKGTTSVYQPYKKETQRLKGPHPAPACIITAFHPKEDHEI